MDSKSSTHQIVVLGGSFAGVRIAHRLLKRIPKLSKATGKSYKLTMITNNTHFWPIPTAPRAMVQPWPEKVEDTFLPLAPGFAQYPADQFELVHAEITGFDTDSRIVTYRPKIAGPEDRITDEKRTITYDTLVVGTGARSPSPLYSMHGSHYPTLEAFKKLHATLPTAKSVLVVGGGTAGVETAGELGFVYGSTKSITLVSGSNQLLPALRKDLGPRAEQYLDSLHVQVIHNATLQGNIAEYVRAAKGPHTVTLSNGQTLTVDILIPAVGRKPYTDIIPPSLLDKTTQSRITVDEQMRATAARPLGSVFAAGDISSTSNLDIVSIEFSMPTLENNIIATLENPTVEESKLKTFNGPAVVSLVPVGPKKGVGILFGWWMPSFLVWLIKGRNLMFPKAGEIVNGKTV